MSEHGDSITRKQAKELQLNLRSASRASDEAWFKYCELLWHAYYDTYGKADDPTPAWYAFGYDTWYDYVETELGLHVTTANTMVRVYHFWGVKMAGAWKGQVLSRQRMRALASAPPKVVTGESLQEWIRKALKLSVCDLEAKLHGKKKKVQMGMSLTPSDAETVKEILDGFIENNPETAKSRGDALVAILTRRTRTKVA